MTKLINHGVNFKIGEAVHFTDQTKPFSIAF